MASLALGFIGEPALAGLIEPLFTGFLPPTGAKVTAHGVALAIALVIVTALRIGNPTTSESSLSGGLSRRGV